jgi:hypothetical protein
VKIPCKIFAGYYFFMYLCKIINKTMRFYKYNSNPLQEVGLGNLEDGADYVTDEGARVRYVEEDHNLLILQPTELALGFTMSDLRTKKAIKTYWSLMKYNSQDAKLKRLEKGE